MASKITGRVNVLVNNKVLLNKVGAKAIGIGSGSGPNLERKSVPYEGGIAGYTETIVPARCEVTIIDREDQSLSELVSIVGDGTVIFQAANGGKVYTMKEATCLGNLSLTSGDGEVSIVFEGSSWLENVNS